MKYAIFIKANHASPSQKKWETRLESGFNKEQVSGGKSRKRNYRRIVFFKKLIDKRA